MKINLATKDGVTILGVTGAVDVHSFQVLKSGITKIFKDGKNKIILNLKGTEKLDTEIIREIAILDILAKELAGRIALSGVSEELRQTISNFSKPPVIAQFSTDEQALEFFHKSAEVAVVEDPAKLKEGLTAKDKEIEALKKQMTLMDPKELKHVREELASVKAQNTELEARLKQYLIDQRKPNDVDAFEQKIVILEETLKELTGKAQAPAAKA